MSRKSHITDQLKIHRQQVVRKQDNVKRYRSVVPDRRMRSLLQHFLFFTRTGNGLRPETLESSADESRYAQVRLVRARYVARSNFRIFSLERIAVLVVLFACLKVAEANGDPPKMNLR